MQKEKIDGVQSVYDCDGVSSLRSPLHPLPAYCRLRSTARISSWLSPVIDAPRTHRPLQLVARRRGLHLRFFLCASVNPARRYIAAHVALTLQALAVESREPPASRVLAADCRAKNLVVIARLPVAHDASMCTCGCREGKSVFDSFVPQTGCVARTRMPAAW